MCVHGKNGNDLHFVQLGRILGKRGREDSGEGAWFSLLLVPTPDSQLVF